MTEPPAATAPINNDTGDLLSVSPDARVDEVVEAVRGWIASAVPTACVEKLAVGVDRLRCEKSGPGRSTTWSIR